MLANQADESVELSDAVDWTGFADIDVGPSVGEAIWEEKEKPPKGFDEGGTTVLGSDATGPGSVAEKLNPENGLVVASPPDASSDRFAEDTKVWLTPNGDGTDGRV